MPRFRLIAVTLGLGIVLAATGTAVSQSHVSGLSPKRLERVTAVLDGEFNWSSQHLDDEVLRCRNGNGDGQTGRVGLRCVRLAGRR